MSQSFVLELETRKLYVSRASPFDRCALAKLTSRLAVATRSSGGNQPCLPWISSTSKKGTNSRSEVLLDALNHLGGAALLIVSREKLMKRSSGTG